MLSVYEVKKIDKKIVYLDNAATSYPKPDSVYEAANHYMRFIGAAPDKTQSSLSIKSAELLSFTRKSIADFFHIADDSRVIFTPNSTYAINAVLYGVLHDNDKVVTSLYEHNSVMRPLGRLLIDKNIRTQETEHNSDGMIDLEDLNRKACGAELLTIAHADNVIGTVQPLDFIADIAHKNAAYIMVDASQSAGMVDIDIDKLNIDFLCVSGNKNMLAPQGVGILILGKDIDGRSVKTSMQGATGSFSEFEIEPDILPDKFEIGTLNMPAIAGLNAAVKFINEKSILSINARTQVMRNRLIEGLQSIQNINIYASMHELTTGILSFTINGIPNSKIAKILNDTYSIMVNSGLQCNPRIHKLLDTYPTGAIRLSLGIFNTFADIDLTINAIKAISNMR